MFPSTSSTSKNQDDGSLNCFIHAVNYTLQFADNQYCRVVCFSPDKQSELKTLKKVKSPVKVQNYKSTEGVNGKDQIIIQKFTKFTPVADVNFSHNKFLSAIGIIPSISVLEKLALEQLVP